MNPTTTTTIAKTVTPHLHMWQSWPGAIVLIALILAGAYVVGAFLRHA